MKAGQSGRCSDREFAFVLDNLVGSINTDGLVSRVLDNSKSLLGIAAGLGLAIPCLDKKLISVVGSLVGYFLKKSARRLCQMGSLEPFVADIWLDLPEGVC